MDHWKIARLTVAIACGTAWTALLMYAVFGSGHVLGDPPEYGVAVVPFVLGPWLAILGSLTWYALRSRGRNRSLAGGAALLAVTALLGIPAAEVLPRYDGDGLGIMWIWLGAIVIPFVAGAAAAPWVEPNIPPRPDGHVWE